VLLNVSSWIPVLPSAPVLDMLWMVVAILVVLWLLGWGFHVAGSFIHVLFVLALILALVNFSADRSTV
jgi:uncharacterized protein DUF5670